MVLSSDDGDLTLLSAATTLALTVIAVYLIHWTIQRKRFIDRVNLLPGPPVIDIEMDSVGSDGNGSNSRSPWLAHLGPIMATVDTIPGHPGIPQVIPCFEQWSRDYAAKGLFRIWAFSPYRVPFARTSVTVTCPDLVRQLLTETNPTVGSKTKGSQTSSNSKLVKERRIFQLADAVVGNSLLALADNAEWKHQRRTSQQAFHQKVLDEACIVATHLLQKVIFPVWDKQQQPGNAANCVNPAKAVEVVELSTRLTLEVLGNVAFSYPFGGLRAYEQDNGAVDHNKEDGKIDDDDNNNSDDCTDDDTLYDNYEVLVSTIAKRLRSPPWSSWLPTLENARFRKCSRRLDATIATIVQERLAKEIASESEEQQQQKSEGDSKKHQTTTTTTTTSKDLLSQLLKKDEDGIRLPFKYIHGNVRMFLFAGHDTTASSMAYALWELAKSPEIQQRLRREVDQLFQSESVPTGENPSGMQLMQLRYLDAVVKETLRLHAPVGVARTAAEDITLKKGDQTFVIPKSASVYIFPRYTHISKEHWPDRPDEFVPDRFFEPDPSSSASSSNRKSPAYLPFSIGPRNCIGQNLANVELKSILAHVVRRYIVTPNEAAVEPIPVFLLTIKPHSVLLDFERRPDVE
jgi:cytochrome P450